MTWLGEHDQESDMALYATQPADNVVGPGICRSEYGGFLLSYPPRRMYDVWQDEDYSFARGKAEVLLLAGIGLFPGKTCGLRGGTPSPELFQADCRTTREEDSLYPPRFTVTAETEKAPGVSCPVRP